MKDGNALSKEPQGEHPWLSIIVPMYNAEKYISSCIESVLYQSFRDFELILVDDGSKDTTLAIANRFAKSDLRIRVFTKSNGGSYQTRLFGAEHARGDYFTFCDADDYYASSNSFLTLYNAAKQYNCSAIQFGYIKKYNHLSRKFSTVKNRLLVEETEFQNREYPKLVCSFWDSSHLTPNVFTKCYHRSLLKSMPASEYAEHVFWGDDTVINLAILEHASSCLFLPDALYVYRQGSGETKAFRIQTMDDLDFIKRNQLLFVQKRGDKSELESVLHSETAGWFFLWVCEALEVLTEQELKQQIQRILLLPGFVSARRYYDLHTEAHWEAAELLRNAEPLLYIEHAKIARSRKNRGVKDKAYNFLKHLYMRV